MSFPYTTTSPPPTSGALTVVDKANESQSYAGGGGGGSVPQNLLVSSISTNVVTVPFLFPSQTFLELGQGAAQNQANIAAQASGSATDLILNITGYANDGNNHGMTIETQAANSKIVISGNLCDIVLENVSSINGALPGGAIPPNLVVSSIQSQNLVGEDLAFVGNGGTIIFDQTGDQNIQFYNGVAPAEIGSRIIGGNTWLHIGGPSGQAEVPVAISSLTCAVEEVGSSAISSLTVSSINGALPGGGSALSTFNQLFTSTIECLNPASQNLIITGNDNNIVIDLETPLITRLRFTPSTSIGNGGGQGPFIKVEDQANGNYTLSIQSDAAPALITSISSLTVSSINGAAPGGGGGGMVFSSISIPGGAGSAFNSDPNVLNQVVTWPIIPNHVYNVNVDCRVQANAPTVTDGDSIYIEVLPNGGTSQAMDSAWGVQVSTLTTNGVWTQVGGSALFKAPVNAVSTCSLGVLGSFSTTTRVDSVTYVDMGDI